MYTDEANDCIELFVALCCSLKCLKVSPTSANITKSLQEADITSSFVFKVIQVELTIEVVVRFYLYDGAISYFDIKSKLKFNILKLYDR